MPPHPTAATTAAAIRLGHQRPVANPLPEDRKIPANFLQIEPSAALAHVHGEIREHESRVLGSKSAGDGAADCGLICLVEAVIALSL